MIDQNSNETWPRANALASPSRSRVFGIVDRTADIKLAAREIVAARFAFGGSSPYAPDLVLVNEFVKEDFLQAAIEESRKLKSGSQVYANEKGKSKNKVSDKIEKFRKSDSSVKVVLEEANAVVLDLPARRPEILETKTEAPVLAVHAVKSLDDAIDFLGSAEGGPALAAYHFGNPQTCKYLAQFVDARVSFVNHVPRELLIGPARPVTQNVDSLAVYTVEMFSLSRPALIQPSTSSLEIAAAMSSANGSAGRELMEQALSPLKAMKRHPGGGVGMCYFARSRLEWVWYADVFCSRFLRARLAHQCRHDPYSYHQCHSSWHYLACEEWEVPVLGLESLSGKCWGTLVGGWSWVFARAHVDNRVTVVIGRGTTVQDFAESRVLYAVSSPMNSSLRLQGT